MEVWEAELSNWIGSSTRGFVCNRVRRDGGVWQRPEDAPIDVHVVLELRQNKGYADRYHAAAFTGLLAAVTDPRWLGVSEVSGHVSVRFSVPNYGFSQWRLDVPAIHAIRYDDKPLPGMMLYGTDALAAYCQAAGHRLDAVYYVQSGRSNGVSSGMELRICREGVTGFVPTIRDHRLAILDPGDWLVIEPDGARVAYTDEQFRRLFVLVSPADAAVPADPRRTVDLNETPGSM